VSGVLVLLYYNADKGIEGQIIALQGIITNILNYKRARYHGGYADLDDAFLDDSLEECERLLKLLHVYYYNNHEIKDRR